MELAHEVRENNTHTTLESAWSMSIAEELVSVKSKLAVSRVKCASICWSVHRVAKGTRKVEDDVSAALMAVSKKATAATKWKVSFNGLELKDASKRLSTHIETEQQAANLRIWAELERDGSGTLQNIATWRAVLHSRVMEVRRSLPHTTDLVVCFDAYIAVVEPGKAEKANTIQSSKGGTLTGDAKNK